MHRRRDRREVTEDGGAVCAVPAILDQVVFGCFGWCQLDRPVSASALGQRLTRTPLAVVEVVRDMRGQDKR